MNAMNRVCIAGLVFLLVSCSGNDINTINENSTNSVSQKENAADQKENAADQKENAADQKENAVDQKENAADQKINSVDRSNGFTSTLNIVRTTEQIPFLGRSVGNVLEAKSLAYAVKRSTRAPKTQYVLTFYPKKDAIDQLSVIYDAKEKRPIAVTFTDGKIKTTGCDAECLKAVDVVFDKQTGSSTLQFSNLELDNGLKLDGRLEGYLKTPPNSRYQIKQLDYGSVSVADSSQSVLFTDYKRLGVDNHTLIAVMKNGDRLLIQQRVAKGAGIKVNVVSDDNGVVITPVNGLDLNRVHRGIYITYLKQGVKYTSSDMTVSNIGIKTGNQGIWKAIQLKDVVLSSETNVEEKIPLSAELSIIDAKVELNVDDLQFKKSLQMRTSVINNSRSDSFSILNVVSSDGSASNLSFEIYSMSVYSSVETGKVNSVMLNLGSKNFFCGGGRENQSCEGVVLNHDTNALTFTNVKMLNSNDESKFSLLNGSVNYVKRSIDDTPDITDLSTRPVDNCYGTLTFC